MLDFVIATSLELMSFLLSVEFTLYIMVL